MQEDRQRRLRVASRLAGLVALLLGGAGVPSTTGLTVLEVARIWRQVYEDLLVGLLLAQLRPDAEVVPSDPGCSGLSAADETSPLSGCWNSPKTLEYGLSSVGQHVQAAPVRHPHDNLWSPRVGRGLHQVVDHRHYHVVALDREPLLPEERLVQELLEDVDLR